MAKKLFSKDKTTLPPNKPNCAECKLCEVNKHPQLRFAGEGRTGVMLITPSPSLEEDEKGDYGYGKEFVFLESTLEDMGYDIQKDFYIVSAMGCHTPRNRAATKKEIKYCSPRLKNLIKRLQPKAVVLLGETAFDMVVGERISGRLTGTPANKFFGDTIPDQELGMWLCPTYSIKEMLSTRSYEDGNESKPLYLRDKALFTMWKNNIENAVYKASAPIVIENFTKYCKTTQDIDQAIDWICDAMDWEYMAWDVEASGLKLHRKGHFIRCMSISNGIVSYAFPNFSDPTFQKIWKKLMLSKVKKIAHNLQYENSSQKILNGYWVNNWHWDTMLSAHVLQNTKPTGLKYCTYVEFGEVGYDTSCEEFIKASKEEVDKYGCNAINRIAEAPIEELLMYNAEDSLFTYWLFEAHRNRASEKQLECIKLYVDTAVTFSKMTENGFCVREERFTETENMLMRLMEEKEKEIMADPLVTQWDSDEVFNFNSTTQLGHLVFDICKMKPIAYTDTGKPSLDKESMEKMNVPFLKKVVEYRELAKLQGTYLDGWKRETVNGIVHSQFLLNTVDTGRSSSTAPNSQNSIKRDKEKKKLVRNPIAPRPGHVLCEFDLKAAETYANLYYSGDPAFKKYLTEKDADMHKQVACKIFLLEPEQVTKEIRNGVKKASFGWFYGSYYVLVAKSMWEDVQHDTFLQEHLKSKGITTYEQYEPIVKKAEDYFWHDMFGAHSRWKDKKWKEYQDKGYLESYTGFRLHAPMDRKAVMNYLPQGTSAQCLYYILNHTQKRIEELKLDAYIIGEVHDSMVISCNPLDEAILDREIHHIAMEQIHTEWTWMSIPLVMEKDRSDVDGSWATMYECGALDGTHKLPIKK